MADKKSPDAESNQRRMSNKKMFLGGIVLGAMLLEAVAVFVVVKMFSGGPKPASAVTVEQSVPTQHDGQQTDAHGESMSGHSEEYAASPDNHNAHAGDSGASDGDQEIELAALTAPNFKSGRMYVYDVCLVARVKGPNVTRFNQLSRQKKNEITAKLSEIIRCASPEQLKEERLETVRRQALHALQEILGEAGLVDEILITKWMVFPGD